MTNNNRNDGEGGERKGWRGESKECLSNRDKGVIRDFNFVERKGRKRERRKQDEIMEEEEEYEEDKSEGEDKNKGNPNRRENKGEEEEEEEGEREEEGKGEKEEESTTADALRLMTPWSFQVGRSAIQSLGQSAN